MKALRLLVGCLLTLAPLGPAAAQGLPLPTFPSEPGRRQVCYAPGHHPDAAFQRRLRTEARRLARAETPGVELWTRVLSMAVDHYQARDDLSTPQRFDAVLRDAGAVLVGERPLVEALSQLRRADRLPILRVSAGRDPRAEWLLAELHAMDDVYAGSDLDVAQGSDFRPGFHDGTRNQIFHSFFYVLMAYFTGSERTTGLGNLLHEVVHPGGSAADYDVGNWAAQLGDWLRRFRDAGNERALDALPSLFGATFSQDALAYGRPEDNDGQDFRAVVETVDRMVGTKLSNPTGGLLGEVKHRAHRGLITVFDWIKRD